MEIRAIMEELVLRVTSISHRREALERRESKGETVEDMREIEGEREKTLTSKTDMRESGGEREKTLFTMKSRTLDELEELATSHDDAPRFKRYSSVNMDGEAANKYFCF